MTWIRELIARHPVATAVVVVALLVVAGRRMYQTGAGPSQVAVQPRPAPAPSVSAPAPPAQTVSPGTSAPGKPVPEPTTSGTGGRTAPSAPSPFHPPVTPGAGGGGARSGGGLLLPPRVPEAPGPGDASATRPSGPPAPVYRVAGIAGIIGDAAALAIVEDGTGSHIVATGDVLGPGVRVVAIDLQRGAVELLQHGAPVVLRLR